MAGCAGVREIACNMIRIGDIVKIIRVAGVAVGRRACKSSARMTACAWSRRMSSGQRKLSQVVVKCGRCPGIHAMALNAVLRKITGSVIRIGCVVVVLEMTANAGCRRTGESTSRMTLSAVQPGMRADQGEPSETRMVEPCEPAVDTVACLALV